MKARNANNLTRDRWKTDSMYGDTAGPNRHNDAGEAKLKTVNTG